LTKTSATTDAGVDSEDAGSDSGALSTPDGGGAILHAIAIPSAKTDPRLAPFAVGMVGAQSDGWDNCWSPTPLRRAPGDCSDCPAPTRATSYLRYTGGPLPSCGAGPDQQCPLQPDSQIYGYFAPALDAGSPQAVWFDLVHIAGDPTDAALTVFATDSGCGTLEELGTWGINEILSEATSWRSACVTITPHQTTAGLGFRFAGANVDLGMQGPWFGSECPRP
jgi:hypothetical protein